MSRREPAPAKVNLCLFLGGARDDGRHELVTLFESVSLCDQLELTPLPAGTQDQVVCPGVPEPNLVSQALQRLRAAGWSAPAVRIEITKRIPVAAGLGGGSADAAAALRLAHAHSPLAPGLAADIARDLGADVPSQLEPGLWLGTGAGELIEPLAPLAEHAFVVVPSAAALSTAEVYREADRLGLPRPSLEGIRGALLASPPRPDDSLLVNDLQAAAQSLCPEIGQRLDAVGVAGADRAMVCGSGPTVIGIWWGPDAQARAEATAADLSARHPGAVAAAPISSSACGTI